MKSFEHVEGEGMHLTLWKAAGAVAFEPLIALELDDDLYLRGLAEFRKVTRDGFAEAFRLAEQALAIDPRYAPAAGLAAICRVNQTSEGWVPVPMSIACLARRKASGDLRRISG
jgi:hypothetical protein